MIPQASNGAWLDDHHVVAGQDEMIDDEQYLRLAAVDVTTGHQRLLVNDARNFPWRSPTEAPCGPAWPTGTG